MSTRPRTVFDRRRVPMLVAAALPFMAATGCGSDDSPPSNVGGAPGAGGATAGVSGSLGGSAAGAPGVAGMPQGGAPSAGGTGGSGAGETSAGKAGASAGAAGTSGASAGSGGASGSAGKGGDSAGGSSGAPVGGVPGGGAPAGGMGGAPTGGTGGTASGAFMLTSPNHEDGAELADKYTCAATGKFNGSLMPKLEWTAFEGAKSYAITFIDVTIAPETNGYHWAIWNIPAGTTSLPEGMKAAQLPQGAKQTGDYLGPCPNVGNPGGTKTDDYEFTIYALSQETMNIMGTGTSGTRDADTKLKAANPLATDKLTGKSDASGGFN